jgi:6-pyruvoyltetrahydropterin/6-carboxytetrahydropterin synthase
MATARLTRVVEFSAAHRYFRPEWPPEQNATVFGACANPHGHGHRYTCRVTVRGDVPDDTGMIVDLRTLDRILQEEVVSRFDHRHINHDVPEFAFGRQIPTVEALAVFVWNRVAPRLPAAVALERVRIEEDPTLYAEYDGRS